MGFGMSCLEHQAVHTLLPEACNALKFKGKSRRPCAQQTPGLALGTQGRLCAGWGGWRGSPGRNIL